jgi:ribosomal protein L16 Arg81 hydroxylase
MNSSIEEVHGDKHTKAGERREVVDSMLQALLSQSVDNEHFTTVFDAPMQARSHGKSSSEEPTYKHNLVHSTRGQKDACIH